MGGKTHHLGFSARDLRGIIRRFDYLLELGINAIYLNPIFQATSSHRYNASDYYKIDAKLGDMEDFIALLDVAHRNNLRVILDGVFNHCGRGFFALVMAVVLTLQVSRYEVRSIRGDVLPERETRSSAVILPLPSP